MTDFKFIILIILGLVVIALILNKPFRQQLLIKFRGRTDEIMNRDANTPEGARDYYNVAIREKEEFYDRAATSYAEICGKVDASEKELYQTQKESMKIDQEIKRCINDNNEEEAMEYAMKKETTEAKIEVLKNTIALLKESKDQQKEIRDAASRELKELKQEKERVVYELEANQQIIELHQSMDENSTSSESARMLERVREGAKKTKEKARGSQIAYNSSAQAMDRRLEESSRQRSARETIEKMKRDMGK